MQIMISVLLLALAANLAADDIPLAVTGLAHPSLRQTPTGDEARLSDQYLKTGLEFLKKGQPSRAIEEFKDSVRLAPRGENYKALGTAYYQDGKKAKAAWAYRESLQLKSDTQVRSLVDALEGRDHPEERFQSNYDELRYQGLLSSGAKEEKAGRRDSALRSYLEAYQLHASPEGARGALRLAADLVDAYLDSKAPARAVQVLVDVQGLKERAQDLNREELGSLKRLQVAEDKVVAMTGQRLRQHQQDMLSDREAWERRVTEALAKKVRDVNLGAPAAR